MTRLVPATCPQCGAKLEFAEGTEKGFCQYCGTSVLVETNKVEVLHQGVVSSLPLCPNCQNTLTEGNRTYKCDLCGKLECYVCSRLNAREKDCFAYARAHGRQIQYTGMALCNACAKQRLATCINCDDMLNGYYTGRPTGHCSKCKGKGKTLMGKPCQACNGTGVCVACKGVAWVRIF